jgi:hypothetical protein
MLKYFLTGFFLIALHLMLLSQQTTQQKIDSLKSLRPFIKDTAVVDCLNELSTAYTLISNRDSAAFYAAKAFKEATRLQYVHGVAEAISRQAGIVQHFENNFNKEDKLAKEALRWFDKTSNKKNIGFLYDQLAFSTFAQSLYDEALGYLQREYDYCKQTGDQYNMGQSIGFMAAIYTEKGDYEKGFDYQQQNLQLALKYKDQAWINGAINGIGTLCLRIKDYPSALYYYRLSFKNFTAVDSIYQGKGEYNTWGQMEFAEIYTHLGQYDSALYRYNLFDSVQAAEKDLRVFLVSKGEYYLATHEYKNALNNFLQGLHYHRKLNDTNEIMRTLLDIGKTFDSLNNLSNALAYTREGLNLALQKKARQFTSDGYELLYSIYNKRHQPDSALLYYRQFVSMKDVVSNEQIKGRFAEYNYKQKITILNQERQLQETRIAKEAFEKKILFTFILVLILLALIIYRNIYLQRKNEIHRRRIAENDLQMQEMESEEKQRKLLHKATQLEVQALRSQMNPHFIFNCLSSINRFILKNESEAASDYLTKFSRLIRMVLINSKQSFITLEDELEMLRLYLEMERLRFKHSFDYSISFKNEIDPGSLFIPPLLLQPFAENAIWHGLMNKDVNGQLLVSLSKENNFINCIIEDNGVGRAKAAELKSKSAEKKKSMGMQITKERLSLLNEKDMEEAYFIVEDLVDHNGNALGTRIILKLRLDEKQEEGALIS